ncbi:MAG: hypothetical protein CL425_09380 [Acidimicrobiaceae bacterium]|nr:hypothetical protein [Acidimicrobiaceae bacterium]
MEDKGSEMLFHITHHHTEATCPAHNDEVAGKTFGIVLDSLKENVNEVIGVWVDGPGHDFFAVVDAESTSQIFAGLFPIIPYGTAKIQPVDDYVDMIAQRQELNS